MSTSPRTYPAPWQGRVILACRKCQKKLKGNRHVPELAKLKRVARQQNKLHPEQPLHILNVPCMDLCPKHAVTVCDPAANPSRLVIVRQEEDLLRLLSAGPINESG